MLHRIPSNRFVVYLRIYNSVGVGDIFNTTKYLIAGLPTGERRIESMGVEFLSVVGNHAEIMIMMIR